MPAQKDPLQYQQDKISSAQGYISPCKELCTLLVLWMKRQPFIINRLDANWLSSALIYALCQSCQVLQVGMKTTYNGPQGQLNIFFGNKSQHPLHQVVCNFPPSPQFQWQMGAFPRSIEPKKQSMVCDMPLFIPC